MVVRVPPIPLIGGEIHSAHEGNAIVDGDGLLMMVVAEWSAVVQRHLH